MSHQAAIMFDFNDARSASIAFELLQELGYDPMSHHETRLHIHVEGNDLASALEIVQSNGGRLVEQADIKDEALTNSAYELDAIAIPAHVVNEDWADGEGDAQGEQVRNGEEDIQEQQFRNGEEDVQEQQLRNGEEDVQEQQQRNWDDDADYGDEFVPDPQRYNHFSGDVHI